MQLPTLLRKWKKDNWMRVLCLRISSNFHFENYVEKLPFCQQVFPANPSLVLESDRQLKTPDTSGLGSQMELALCVQDTVSLKMFPVSSQQKPQMENRYSSMSSEIWNKEVINARSAYSVRKKLALHTKGNECSSWPTPQASEEKANRHRNNPNAKGSQVWLTTKVMDTWATPQASDHIEGARTAKESNQKCLGRDLNQMKWATPNTMDHLPPKTGEALARNKKKGGCKNLREDVNNPKMNWPTPRAGNPGSRKPGTGGKILAEEAKKSWATPQGRDHLSAESKEKWEARAKLQAEKGVNLHLPLNTQCQHIMEEQHNGLQDQEKSNTSGKNQGSPKLSANWVEQLMGLSTGWTDLGSWATELSPKPQN
jgi:hypothetical protein